MSSETRPPAQRLTQNRAVQVFDAGRLEDGQTFLAMQFVAGHDLRAWCQHKSRIWRAVRDVFCQAGRGLEAAHRAGIVHRDFKPKNSPASPGAPPSAKRRGSPQIGGFGECGASSWLPTVTPVGSNLDQTGLILGARARSTSAGCSTWLDGHSSTLAPSLTAVELLCSGVPLGGSAQT